MTTVKIQIYGRVQGVFFRSEARKMADKLQITGWIRNNPDGSVTALAQGEDDAVNNFIEWCGKGPSFAKVEKVKTTKTPGENPPEDIFRII